MCRYASASPRSSPQCQACLTIANALLSRFRSLWKPLRHGRGGFIHFLARLTHLKNLSLLDAGVNRQVRVRNVCHELGLQTLRLAISMSPTSGRLLPPTPLFFTAVAGINMTSMSRDPGASHYSFRSLHLVGKVFL